LIASSVGDLHGDAQRDRNNIQAATALDVKARADTRQSARYPNQLGLRPPGIHRWLRPYLQELDLRCDDPATSQPEYTADRARAMLGHSNRSGGQNTSWNAAHLSRRCSKRALINTGGAGHLYRFATN
jgi:hypothetical protein